ncbi:methyltransferase domain-containing protein [Roseobacter sp.]|uniref:methyltransferase domain-containing protein n=1 Tax=Roseobacter sp. TaxID=1907202 RepID=UPI003297A7DF
MTCLVCAADRVEQHLDVGTHPVASFFLATQDAPEQTFGLRLGQCARCGTVQMMQPVPHSALIPPYDWLLAREPEEHLDQTVDQILAYGTLGADSVIAGVSYKDDTTIDRFRAKGFNQTWRLDLAQDLGIADPRANIETVQKFCTPDRMAEVAQARAPADLLIVRHITEHAENLGAFMAGLAALVKPEGLIMLEIPDCSANLIDHDYCMVWEEHSLYFTPQTFGLIPPLGGFKTLCLDVHPRPFENSLVLIAQKTDAPSGDIATVPEQRGLLAAYASAYDKTKTDVRTRLEAVRAEQGPIALFGAGHLAHAFVNFLDIADLIDFVADDTPQKQGKFLPGARLPILPSSALVERGVKLCLLALSINNEDAVIGRNQAFVDAGGAFRSVFQSSPRSIFEPDG